MEKRNTVRKKMSMRDYVNLMNYFKTGELEMDLSEYETTALSKVEVRVMRFNSAEKAKMDKFFAGNPFGMSVQSALDSLPKKKVIAPKPESKVQVVYQQAPTVDAPTISAPIAAKANWLAPAADEHPRPEGYVCPDTSFYVDANLIKPNVADNINLNTVIDLISDDILTEDDFWYQFGADMYDIRGIHPSEFVFDESVLPPSFSGMNWFNEIFSRCDARKEQYKDVMNEPEPTEDDKFNRFKGHAKAILGYSIKHPTLSGWASVIDSIEKIDNNKIFIEEEADKVCEYDSVDELEHDMIYLSNQGFIEDETMYNVFGKKTSVDKIIKKLYKKYPKGMGNEKLYYSRREAYLDGALKI